jgi:hypothetical protein
MSRQPRADAEAAIPSRITPELDALAASSVLNRGFFFFNVFVDQARHTATAETTRRLMLGLAFGITHEAPIEWLFRADEVIVVKSQFATLAAL